MGAGLEVAMGPVLSGLLGNVQITWGTNWQAVYGTAVQVNHGNQITITGEEGPTTKLFKEALPICSMLYQLAFFAIGSHTDILSELASELYIANAAMVPLLNATLMTSEMFDKMTQMTLLGAAFAKMGAKINASLAVASPALVAGWTNPMVSYLADHAKISADAPLTPADMGSNINIVGGAMVQAATSILIMAQKAKGPDPSFVYIDAYGDGTDGLAFINASKTVHLTSGGASVVLQNQNTTAGTITLNCGTMGEIVLLNTPMKAAATALIDMTMTSITLRSGSVAGGASITLDAIKGIKLQAGPNVSIVMDPLLGITMQASPTLIAKIDPILGIKLTNTAESILIDSIQGTVVNGTLFTNNTTGLVVVS